MATPASLRPIKCIYLVIGVKSSEGRRRAWAWLVLLPAARRRHFSQLYNLHPLVAQFHSWEKTGLVRDFGNMTAACNATFSYAFRLSNCFQLQPRVPPNSYNILIKNDGMQCEDDRDKSKDDGMKNGIVFIASSIGRHCLPTASKRENLGCKFSNGTSRQEIEVGAMATNRFCNRHTHGLVYLRYMTPL